MEPRSSNNHKILSGFLQCILYCTISFANYLDYSDCLEGWFLHKSWSNTIFRISTQRKLQNLNQKSASRLHINFKILTNPSFRISTKIQLHNLYKISAEKGGQTPVANFAWTWTSKSWPNLLLKTQQKFIFMTKPQLPNLQHVLDNNIKCVLKGADYSRFGEVCWLV